MAVKIRLTRTGRHNDPSYRIVAADSRFPRDGRYIELLGTFDPLMNTTKIDEEKAIKWIKDGAQLSDTVRALFSKAGIIAKVSKKGE
ncbi:MAG: 30S ribosomal protein S16 [Erysipelotrichaceae bacterium]|nr:30S ribosomal protein S16 [Erysipelotrichaceae bacterium]